MDAVRDVFILVEDSCELVIEPAADSEGDARQAGDTATRALEEPRAGSGGRRNYDKLDSASSLRVPAVKLDQFVDLVGRTTRATLYSSSIFRAFPSSRL
jgi:hypothetical protein